MPPAIESFIATFVKKKKDRNKHLWDISLPTAFTDTFHVPLLVHPFIDVKISNECQIKTI